MQYERLEEEVYAGWETETLVTAFYESDFSDLAMGRELNVRVFEHADFVEDPRTMPLMGRDGLQLQGAHGPLTWADYINFAVQNSLEHPEHLDAVDELLTFLSTVPGTPEYEEGRLKIMAYSGATRR